MKGEGVSKGMTEGSILYPHPPTHITTTLIYTHLPKESKELNEFGFLGFSNI
jgi:hypothetical protein